MRVLMRLRMLLPDIADAHTHPHSMPMHEPGPVYLLRRAVRKLQLPALRVLLQPARNPHAYPDSYSDSYPHPVSYPYLHPYAYSHSAVRPVARPRSPA